MVDDSASITPAMLDPEALKMLFAVFDNRELVHQLINDYLKEAAVFVADLETLSEKRDVQKVRYVAHSLKGSSLSYGATTLANLCKTLEDEAQLGQFEKIPERIAQLKAELLKVELALRTVQTKNE